MEQQTAVSLSLSKNQLRKGVCDRGHLWLIKLKILLLWPCPVCQEAHPGTGCIAKQGEREDSSEQTVMTSSGQGEQSGPHRMHASTHAQKAALGNEPTSEHPVGAGCTGETADTVGLRTGKRAWGEVITDCPCHYLF